MFRKSAACKPCFFALQRNMSQAAAPGKMSGRVAVVTASTEGIGFAIARRLCEDGAKVVVSSRRAGNVEKAVATLQGEGFADVVGVQCNVSKEKDRQTLIHETMNKFGHIDVLVSNAAVNPAMGDILNCPEPVWDKIFDVNVKSALLLTQLVVPHMQSRSRGSIVYVSSIGGFNIMPLLGAYCVSKTALLGLTKAVALQVADDNIRVNCVAPGVIKTKFSAPIFLPPPFNKNLKTPAVRHVALRENSLTSVDGIKEAVMQQIPMGRVGEPHEVAGLVAFLASDDSTYVTGENFVVAGGMASRL